MASGQTVRSCNGGNAPHEVSDTSDSLYELISDSMLTMGGMYSNTMHPNAAFPPREILLATSRRTALRVNGVSQKDPPLIVNTTGQQ